MRRNEDKKHESDRREEKRRENEQKAAPNFAMLRS